MKFWDAWYGKHILSGQADYYFTDLLFYPQGLSLIYHNFSIPHMLVFGGLQAFMPASNAYSLTFLLIVASVTCSAYVYMLYLFKDKWIALLGAIIVGMSPYVVGYPEHPELRFIATVPLSLYFFHRGIAERQYRLVLVAAVTTGITAYISMYIAVCLVIALSMYVLYFSVSRLRELAYWVALGLFVVIVGTVSSLRVFPMLKSDQALDQAMASRGDREINNDLLIYFVNARHPITELLFRRPFGWETDPLASRATSYLGYTALFLIGLGFLRNPYRRNMIPWLVFALPFLVLRLGSVLTIDGVPYPNIVLPKHFLDELIPGAFEAFYVTSIFYIGALVPLAALACFGTSALLNALPNGRRPLIVLLLVGLVSFEYYQPVREGVITKQELKFLDWLDEESVDVRLVNLPIDNWSSNLYGFTRRRMAFATSKESEHVHCQILMITSREIIYSIRGEVDDL